MVFARKYVLLKDFQGEPKQSDFKISEEELPPLQDGQYLVQAEYMSVDPYMRAYMIRFKKPVDMIGGQVAKIIESKNADFPVGRHVCGNLGWKSHSIVGPNKPDGTGIPTYLLPEFGGLPYSLGLGALGMPGNTAYFGFLELCQPKSGETVVVTGAAGAVGSLVGQIARIKGCRVIGFAGSDAKCQWLKQELGFDYAFNYKTVNAQTALKEAAPKGIDCYFDNVGGELSGIIMDQMNRYGRVAVCGSISVYNDDVNNKQKAPVIQPTLVAKELRVEGFLVARWANRWMEGITQLLEWISEGKIKYREELWEGFDNMVEAFIGMLRGENTGKAIIKV